MIMNVRTKYMVDCMATAFDEQTHTVQENTIQAEKYAPLVKAWMNGTGPPQLFVYHQPEQKIMESGEVKATSTHADFFVTDGDGIKLLGKGVYFLRCLPAGQAVNDKQAYDSEVLFGEVSDNSVLSLNALMNNVYKPLMDKVTPEEWGVCETEQKRDFSVVFEKFGRELQEAVKSQNSNISLEPYDEKYEKEVKAIHSTNKINNSHTDMINEFMSIFAKWSEKIESALEESTGARQDKDEGPRDELEYWKLRMRMLTTVSEQIRSTNCKDVQTVLTATSQSDSNKHADSGIYLALSNWRSIELRVTENLNEAKDNVKYLQTLERFIEPLYDGTPNSIRETLPVLMNSIKMIHTVARYYNTDERMTGLFVKITNQMIVNCKMYILTFKKDSTSKAPKSKKGASGLDDSILWESDIIPHDELIDVMKQCQALHETYQAQYEFTKKRLEHMPKTKQFDFSPTKIFGRFDLFKRRVGKLIDLFSTIQQFRTLEKHNLENIDKIIEKFDRFVKKFKSKNHRLLEYRDDKFDRDFVEFNVDISSVETDLAHYINDQFTHISDLVVSLRLLRKFESILHRPSLQNGLQSKYNLLFQQYGNEIEKIKNDYQKDKEKPPIVRNLPPVSGAITWSRHLFYRISVPMEQFPPDLVKQRQNNIRQHVRNHNSLGYTLFSYEYMWRKEWQKEVDRAKAGLQATLFIRHYQNLKLYVNFDSEIMTLIREAKCLARIGIEIPESAKIVLLQEEKFKNYNNQLQYVVRERVRVVNKIRPNTRSLLAPHIDDLERRLRPGICSLTWTSMNIDGFLHHVHQGLSKLDQLIININDIMENRIENNLKALSKTILVDLPQDSSTFSLDEFVDMQEQWIKTASKKLRSKNYEVEGAVEDLLQTICSYQLDPTVHPIPMEDIIRLSKYYNWSMYQALLHATKYSLNQMKERICGRSTGAKKGGGLKPFFEVEVFLDQGKTLLKPSLDDVQHSINKAASAVLKSTKKVQNWNQKDLPEDERKPFYTWIARDKEIVKVILLLTGSIQGTRKIVVAFQASFEKFAWLWKKNMDEELKAFHAKNPQLEDYEARLRSFEENIQEINQIEEHHQIGALSLKTEKVKDSLREWVEKWKFRFSKDLHKKSKAMLENLMDELKQIQLKIDKPAVDIDSLGSVMSALEEIRKKQSDFSHQIRPVNEMYKLLEIYFPDIMDKDESDNKDALDKRWVGLVEQADTVRAEMHEKKAEFKEGLIYNVKNLVVEVDDFREAFDKYGPGEPGLAPNEALERLKAKRDEFEVIKKKYDTANAGESLFGLPHQEYAKLVKTEDEINLLDKLYGLYQKTQSTFGQWNEQPFTTVQEDCAKMIELVETFQRDCLRLPGQLKKWLTYTALKNEIDDMIELLPVVEGLAKDSIRDRHWEEVIELTGVQIPFDQETFVLKQLFDANLLKIKEEVEDITDNADKQLKLENQLRNDIIAHYDTRELTVNPINGVPSTIGGDIADIQTEIEDHVNQLNQMAVMRYVGPFKNEVTEKIGLLSSVSEVIEKWLKVQGLWQSLVTVFTEGDIAKALPQDAAIFGKVHKAWLKIMERANEAPNVIVCCANDILVTQLPGLQQQLEHCQKQLDGYLGGKCALFPRFYFCSGNDLLKILSMGSNPQQLQDDFEKLYAGITSVTFNEEERSHIDKIHMKFAGFTEDIELFDSVVAEGNIENWLTQLTDEMQRSMRNECKTGCQDCTSMPLRQFIFQSPSQVSLLGVQKKWTDQMEDALILSHKDRRERLEVRLKEVFADLALMSVMCLEEIPSKLQRTKLETLVTIQVYQRDQSSLLRDLYRSQPHKSMNDFEWQSNTRVYWRQDEATGIADTIISICDIDFVYSYEFLGVRERLAITPLTNRCYITLSQALGMCYGGAPAGPAGTGKTETTKDLACTLGIWCVVFNCSPEFKFRNTAKIFKGLCAAGVWGCFDEFNRISLPTLSVVAAQVESITLGKKMKQKLFEFPGFGMVVLKLNVAYFITMNPGYAGRQELPENLKVLFRGVTMMLPDRQVIMKVKLASMGYTNYEPLSIKFNVLYKLCEMQLSKTRHYDFGLRNILSVLRTTGTNKRSEKEGTDEEMIVARTLRDMNMSKFIAQDIPLFGQLIDDIFPRQKNMPNMTHEAVEKQVKIFCLDQNLQIIPQWKLKIIQLYETSLVRHGIMVVGSAGCGKTTIFNILLKSLEAAQGVRYKSEIINPKSVTNAQLFGEQSASTGEWVPGVLAEIWKKVNNKQNKHTSWIICDGPVDAIWIESMNTVLDDNRMLTLANAERIPMADSTKMTFEVENLNNASPATVSRAGIIFVSPEDLSWRPLVDTWCEDRDKEKSYANPEEKNWVREFVVKYIEKTKMLREISSKYLYMMQTPAVVRATMLLNLLEASIQVFTKERQEIIDRKTYEMIFIYSLAWSMAGLMETDDRVKFHKELLEKAGAPLPQISAQKQLTEKESVFDYYVDPETKQWQLWAPEGWTAPKKIVFSQLLIPTSDSTRAEYIIDKISKLPLERNQKRGERGLQHTLLVGAAGTAKTSVVLMYAAKFNGETQSFKRINFSSATRPGNFQGGIEGEIQKHQTRIYRPIGGKQMLCFLDDLSMPKINDWGDQETLEIVRFVIEQRGLYTLNPEDAGSLNKIEQMKYCGAMRHPTGGRNSVPDRVQRHFFCLNMTPPAMRSVQNIYGRILEAIITTKKYPGKPGEEIIGMKNLLIEATINIWESVSKRLLPTPTKFHYEFNIRDLARVFQGICRVAYAYEYKIIQNCSRLKEKIPPQLFMIGLWRHECERTFVDKLITHQDKKVFLDMLNKITKEKFRDACGYDDDMLMTDMLFADFQRDAEVDEYGSILSEAPYVYEACPSINAIKKRTNERLQEYNEKYPSKKMELVIFDDALFHLLRTIRTVNSPAGNALLVGVGGSGKQSLTKLSAFICKHRFFQIALTKSYGEKSLMEDIKELFGTVCNQNGQVSFIITDQEIKSDGFLELINSLLATGEIPGMLTKDDKEMFMLGVKPYLQKELGKGVDPTTSQLVNYFLNRVKDCLHIILAFSPVGTKFRTRASMFPSLFSQCSIDWFLPWPKEALIDVSGRFIGSFDIECTKEVKEELVQHMGACHDMVRDIAETYFERMRKSVFTTPKSYLSFLAMYKDLYKKKWDEIDIQQSSISSGLDKLLEATVGVGEMKKMLMIEDQKLRIASEETNKLIATLTIENEAAEKKTIECESTKAMVINKKQMIGVEKEAADRDLQAAMPFVEAAEKALSGIKPNDITELKAMKVLHPIGKIILDCCQVLFMFPMSPVSPKEFVIQKKTAKFISDSYDDHTAELFQMNLLGLLGDFGENSKDLINEETIELLAPYLELTFADQPETLVVSGDIAKGSSSALKGMCDWARAMSDYHKASKIVKPKLRLLNLKAGELKVAEAQLEAAMIELDAVIKKKAALDAMYAEKQGIKDQMQADANKLKRKMDQATKLIDSLMDNKVAWTESAAQFSSQKIKLAGDVAKASAFVSYCGPFNAEFREILSQQQFVNDLNIRKIPNTEGLLLTNFLVDEQTVGDWNMEGLPSDDLSIQNGIMVTRSSRFPLMIDPQSQAISWIKSREPELEQQGFIFTLGNPNLRDALKLPLMDGGPVLIENIENEVDPMLDPLLEKQISQKGRNKLLRLGDQEYDYDDKFRLYMTSRMSNPLWSPELAAKTTIIDFAVTITGLEQQLLGRLITREQKQLEDQLNGVKESVNLSKKTLAKLEADLLERLANAEGSLLDDVELIDVLGNIKTKSAEVKQSLEEAQQTSEEIGVKREAFRPVAARGAVLYFCIVEMAGVNWMYNVSLDQFIEIFYDGIDNSPKAQIIKDRVANICYALTYKAYRYINRGIFERDKITFKLMMCLRILIQEGVLLGSDVAMLLKAGAAVDDRNKKFNWLDQRTWNNVIALTKHKFGQDGNMFYKGLVDSMTRSSPEWRAYFESDDPESQPVPDYDDKINADQTLGSFLQFCLCRCFREDRTGVAGNQFIAKCLDPEFSAPVNDMIAEIHAASLPNKPVLYLLSTGADPTASIDDYARKFKKFPTKKTSMGEEMEGPALQQIKDGFKTGDWVILNNCHLSLEFMAEMETVLNPKDVEVHEDFRLWITCAPDKDFPLGLLQMAIKVTLEPPKGMKAGLGRTFNTMVNQDFIEKVEPYEKWRPVTFAVCFLHSVVQERRKFGPIGFSMPYEFNASDLDASMLYMEKHMTTCLLQNRKYEWEAMQQMCCSIQYGGKITQEEDRALFFTYGYLFIREDIFSGNFMFNQQPMDYNYMIPDFPDHVSYMAFINAMPAQDNPLVFGLNPNADLTASLNESRAMIATLIDTQPSDAASGGGKSPEQTVKEIIENEFLKALPEDFKMLDVEDRLKAMKHRRLPETGKSIPLVMFLFQEIQRFQNILGIVRKWMTDMCLAIDGQIIMSPEIATCIKFIFDLRVPTMWLLDPSGAEIAWLAPTLSGWLGSMTNRHFGLSNWLAKDRPISFWLTGFFNPQGFLTSVSQEITRAHRADNWALDAVESRAEVADPRNTIIADDARIEGKNIAEPAEGVWVHGLWLEGAAWNKPQRFLEDSKGKDLFFAFPNIKVYAECPSAEQKGPGAPKKATVDDKNMYSCPVYKYPMRQDRYLCTKFNLKPEPPSDNKGKKGEGVVRDQNPMVNQWRLRGVALLCQKE